MPIKFKVVGDSIVTVVVLLAKLALKPSAIKAPTPSFHLSPPGSAVNPVLLVAPDEELQCAVPASSSAIRAGSAPPRKFFRTSHSKIVGICHPLGQAPWAPGVFDPFIKAVRLYNLP